jgi:hypothetical protein
MPAPDEKDKFDRVSGLVLEFSEIACRLGEKYKVAGKPFGQEGRPGSFQLKRHLGAWGIVWAEEGEERPVRDWPLAVKRLFLKSARRFFDDYLAMAKEWETTIDQDIASAVEALTRLRNSDPQAGSR